MIMNPVRNTKVNTVGVTLYYVYGSKLSIAKQYNWKVTSDF